MTWHKITLFVKGFSHKKSTSCKLTISIIFLNLITICLAQRVQNCQKGYPFLSIGDFNLTQVNFDEKISKHQNILVQVTSVFCENCCKYEVQINSFKRNFLDNKDSILYNYDIKIGRVNIANNDWFVKKNPEKHKIPHLPYWIMYKNGKPYTFLYPKNEKLMLINIIKILENFHLIQSFDNFELFLRNYETDEDGSIILRTKVLALFDSVGEYEEILDSFLAASAKLIWRLDLNFGVVTDPKVLREIYKKYGKKFFDDEFDKNSLVIFSNKNRFEDEDRIIKLTDFDSPKFRDLQSWITSSSTVVMDEFTSLNERAYPKTIPLLLAFLDPEDYTISYDLIKGLRKIGSQHKYHGRINFAWLNFRDNKLLMKELGLYQKK